MFVSAVEDDRLFDRLDQVAAADRVQGWQLFGVMHGPCTFGKQGDALARMFADVGRLMSE